MIKSFRLFNESIHNIQYTKEVDEDGDNIEISAYLDGNSIAKLSFEILMMHMNMNLVMTSQKMNLMLFIQM